MSLKNTFILAFAIVIVYSVVFCASEQIDAWDIDYTIRYTTGKRQPGDKLVQKDHYNRNQTHPFTMTYNFGFNDDSTVTYAELYARQSGPKGTIRILKGGIGQKEIHLAVATFDALYFDLESHIYGIH